MTGESRHTRWRHRDGTSQAGRRHPALDPDYVLVDERSTEDLLRFARDYSEELVYFGIDDQADGDWSGFIGAKADLQRLAAFAEDSDGPGAEVDRGLSPPPHLALFLTFLRLFGHAQARMNDLTRRHLEFYYREVLGLTPKTAVPDHVHVLVTLANGQEQHLLPAGTPLAAGKDSQGADLVYRTDNDILVNRARVASCKSLHVDKTRIGLGDVRGHPDLLIALSTGASEMLKHESGKNKAFLAMLAMALGEPGPGGELADYSTGEPLTGTLLRDLDRLLDFIRSELCITLPVFRELMELKRTRDADNESWDRINHLLEQAAQRRGDSFQLDRSQRRNFEKNLQAAVGLAAGGADDDGRPDFGTFFDGRPDVENVYDLYRRRDRQDAQAFIQNNVNMPLDEFDEMMALIGTIHRDWQHIYDILRTAARRRWPKRALESPDIRAYREDKWASLVAATLGKIEFPTVDGESLPHLDKCYEEMRNLETYFHMAVEDFAFVREVHAKKDAKPWELASMYERLENAHADKALQREREAGFDKMIRFVLGDPNPGDDLPERKNFPELDDVADADYIRDKLFLEIANFEFVRNTEAKGKAATAEDWNIVYRILEQAQRRKRGRLVPRATIERWENVYAAPDATRVRVLTDGEAGPDAVRWRTFGDGFRRSEDDTIRPAPLGIALVSPLLALAEGVRTITLTVGFADRGFDKVAIENAVDGAFRFLLSGAQGMVAAPEVKCRVIREKQEERDAAEGAAAERPYRNALEFTITLDAQAPPVVPLAPGTAFAAPYPVLQMLLADIAKEGRPPTKRYRPFRKLALERIRLGVRVDGLRSLTLENDEGALDAKKPFEPFGHAPVAGASFFMANPEICSKRLEKLGISIDWMGVPDNLHEHYRGYKNYEKPDEEPPDLPESSIADNCVFKATLRLHDRRAAFEFKEEKEKVQLFHAEGEDENEDKTKGAVKTAYITIAGDDIAIAYPNYGQDLQPVVADEAIGWSRYWELELCDPDFQHDVYPRAAAGYANRKGQNGPFIVKPPYTPKIKRLSVGYCTSVEIDPAAGDPAAANRLYHVEPFGHRAIAGASASFLPQYDHEGELYIGIAGATPPQTVSLLFQMAEGSADPDLPVAKVEWSYLDGDQWKGLERGNLIGDTTRGLLTSGIVTVALPEVMPSTLLPAGEYWIRAAVAENGRSLADTVAVEAQAVRATFYDDGNAPDHLDRPLPAGTITGLASPRPEVKRIDQPYSSSGGERAERPSDLYVRGSERLRHKNRALTSWDYERMILEAFPEIYKVKCLPAGTSEDPRRVDRISIVVIPDIRGKRPFDPFEPKAPADTLSAIERYLSRHGPPDARFEIRNPTYIRLRIRVGVRFREGYDPRYHMSRLQQALQIYLAPWAYDQSADIVFGGRINSSLIVNFLEARPYVDYVANVKLFTSVDGKEFTEVTPGATGERDVADVDPDAILVSARRHDIDLIPEAGYEEIYFTGIDYMKIELDFKVDAR